MLLDPPSVGESNVLDEIGSHLGGVQHGAFSAGAVSIVPTDAMTNVGRTATVWGVVASANYAVGTRANPTFLTVANSDQSGPDRALTAVIFGHDRAKFGTPETTLSGRQICVTGHISFFRGRPEMILSTPRQVVYSLPPTASIIH